MDRPKYFAKEDRAVIYLKSLEVLRIPKVIFKISWRGKLAICINFDKMRKTIACMIIILIYY